MILDDDLSDKFDTWLEDFQGYNLIEYAENWGKEIKSKEFDRGWKEKSKFNKYHNKK